MGIHISCDNCYKSIKNTEFVTIKTTSNNPRFSVFAEYTYCFPCMKAAERFYMHLENPNYIAPPKEVSDEVKPAE